MTVFKTFPLTSEGLPAVKWSQPCNHAPQAGETYGLPTGKRNDIWVLDIDRKNGKDGLRALHAHMTASDVSLPDTYTCATKNGGLHLYFRLPSDGTKIGNRVGVLPGLDVRGEGGYVRAGEGYPVIVQAEVADAPEWLLDLVKSKATAPAVSALALSPEHPLWDERIAKAAAYLARAEPCVSGVNGQKMIWLVSLQLSRTLELPIATSLELLKGYNSRCTPPWDVADWARTLERAATHGQTTPGTFSDAFLGGVAQPAQRPDVTPDDPPPGMPAALYATRGAWRQVRNPDHKYTFDLADEIQGSRTCSEVGQRDVTGAFTGPGAAADWVGVIQYDQFRRRTLAVNPPLKLHAEISGFESTDIENIRMWFACVPGNTVTSAQIEAAIKSAASAASFHPVRDYLDALPKVDPKSADEFFKGIAGRLWGAAPDRVEVESGHLRRFAIAAVRRIRRPGTQVDTMLVLTGPQGFFKSTWLEKLFSTEWYTDQVRGVDSKEGSISLEGIWGAEIAEGAAFLKVPEAVKKEFISRREDKYRPHYEKGVIVRPRETVFACTTNVDEFLEDPTGARRYDVCEVCKPIDLPGFDRDEFWAMANALEKTGEPHWQKVPEDPTSKSAEGQRYAATDPWDQCILGYCAGKEHVRADEALRYGPMVPLERQDKRAKDRVAAILRRFYGPSKVVRVGDKTSRVYVVK